MTTDLRPAVGGDVDIWGDKLLAWLAESLLNDGRLNPPAFDTFGRGGTLTAPITGAGRSLFAYNATIVGAIAVVSLAPTGASIICDVNKNGTTIFTTQANRPTIAAGAIKTTTMPVPDVTALAVGDYLSVDIDQVGSGIAGSDLIVKVFYRLDL